MSSNETRSSFRNQKIISIYLVWHIYRVKKADWKWQYRDSRNEVAKEEQAHYLLGPVLWTHSLFIYRKAAEIEFLCFYKRELLCCNTSKTNQRCALRVKSNGYNRERHHMKATDKEGLNYKLRKLGKWTTNNENAIQKIRF